MKFNLLCLMGTASNIFFSLWTVGDVGVAGIPVLLSLFNICKMAPLQLLARLTGNAKGMHKEFRSCKQVLSLRCCIKCFFWTLEEHKRHVVLDTSVSSFILYRVLSLLQTLKWHFICSCFTLGEQLGRTRPLLIFDSEMTDGQCLCYKVHSHPFLHEAYWQMVHKYLNKRTRHRETIKILYKSLENIL